MASSAWPSVSSHTRHEAASRDCEFIREIRDCPAIQTTGTHANGGRFLKGPDYYNAAPAEYVGRAALAYLLGPETAPISLQGGAKGSMTGS